ncbi:plasmid transfer protein [Yersinia hibernica]|uniref:Plasmid transfer protein n=1 Tax=Yersinia hibernica TaxID=2339259 RepID=A0ABX5R3U9_9GAMM|nr:plasmid transfer protein [Yersinia hibernica]QAX80315.1 plasmid transfer protein [Yersinia hibernica]
MIPETLPEQEPALAPGATDSAGDPHSTPVRRPVFSMRKPKWLKRVAIGVAAIVIIAPGVLSLVLFQQLSLMDIRLNSLEAAFRSGQLSQLSTSVAILEKHITEQDERFALKDGVVKGMSTLGQTLDGKIADQNQKIGQLESQINEQKKTLQYELDDSQARALEFASLKSSLEAIKTSRVEKAVGTSAGNTVSSEKNPKTPFSKKPHRSARTVPLAAPFILTGIEQRGGQTFAVVAPQGATTLSEMLLLSPGDYAWGWQLRSIQGNEALFSVNGIPQRLTAQ